MGLFVRKVSDFGFREKKSLERVNVMHCSGEHL